MGEATSAEAFAEREGLIPSGKHKFRMILR